MRLPPSSTVAMASPAITTVPEVRYEEVAMDVAALTGLTVEEVRSDW